MDSDDHPERVERLCQVEAKVALLRRAELRGERVGRDLQRSEARGKDEQCSKDGPEIACVRARDDEETTAGHQRERAQDHVHRSNATG
jgi:hypothetical protein